jgi:branched-chain amino acid transport system ATP-binding protein
MTAILQVNNIDAYYGPIQALRGVSLEVHEGEIVTLIGANGAGKSTLLMSIFGQPRVRSGSIYFAGEDITQVASHHIARRGLSQVPEGRHIFPAMTVDENLLMGAVPIGPEHVEADRDSLISSVKRTLQSTRRNHVWW